MSKFEKKFYVVWEGRTPGIYTDWQTCEQQVKSFPGARFRSFSNYKIAEEAFTQNYTQFTQQKLYERFPTIEKNSICVDAACNGSPGRLEYRGVEMVSSEIIFHKQFPLGTNNIGEFLAIVHALAWLAERQRNTTTVYSDSKIAIKWVNDKKTRSRLIHNAETASLHALLIRAEHWLQSHTVTNPILKWLTKQWGQIPADFGRK